MSKTPINADPNDPDWMYKPIIRNAFTKVTKKDSYGNREELDSTQ
jgi:hypothetical protein